MSYTLLLFVRLFLLLSFADRVHFFSLIFLAFPLFSGASIIQWSILDSCRTCTRHWKTGFLTYILVYSMLVPSRLPVWVIPDSQRTFSCMRRSYQVDYQCGAGFEAQIQRSISKSGALRFWSVYFRKRDARTMLPDNTGARSGSPQLLLLGRQ